MALVLGENVANAAVRGERKIDPMAFRRRGRKPRVVWLPVHGRDLSSVTERMSANGIGGFLTVPNDGSVVTDVQAVTFDYSDSASAEEGTDYRSLQDLTSGNAYRLRRLVGKVHCGAALLDGGTGYTSFPLIDVAAGFIVCRTDSSGNVLSGPLDAAGNLGAGPLAQDGAEDPWIWRRRWLFTPAYPALAGEAYDPATQWPILSNFGNLQPQWPNANWQYGSVQDGPHLDQKTARIISREERLTFWIQARTITAGTTVHTAAVPFQVDIRILASLRMQSGNRRNASR